MNEDIKKQRLKERILRRYTTKADLTGRGYGVPEENLIASAVYLAIEDMRKSLTWLRRARDLHGENAMELRAVHCEIVEECEAFIRNEGSYVTSLDPESIIAMVRREVYESTANELAETSTRD